MPGLGAWALAGAAGGVGEDIVKRAEQAREDALMRLKRGWDVEDREDNQSFDRSMQSDRQGFDREMYGLRRGDEIEDRDLRRAHELSDRDHEEGREEERIGRTATVYESLFGTESGGDFNAANDEGYVGRSQFGQDRLDDWSRANGTPRVTIDQFKGDENLQKAVEEWHFRDINERIDRDKLVEKYEGKVINGVKMTRSGIIAMAHLGGYGGAKMHLEQNGGYNPSDSNGTSLSDYARTHGGLDTDMSKVWRTLADPNVDESVKDDIRDRVGLDQSGSRGAAVSGEEWIDNGDGTETLMGRTSKGDLVPYLRNGKPVKQKKKPDKAGELSRDIIQRIEDDFEQEIASGDRATPRAIEAEIARLVNEEGMSENEAFRAATAAARWRDTIVENEGWGNGPRKETVDENNERRGEFIGFDYGEGVRTTIQPPPARPSAPPKPSLPADPGRGGEATAGSDAAGLPRPRTQAERDRLPSGARYIAPNGEVKVKS